MENFKFEIDEKITTWRRTPVSIKAKNKKEAIEILSKILQKEGNYFEEAMVDDKKFTLDENILLLDTCEEITIQDNGGFSTIEAIDEEGNSIYSNHIEGYI